MAGQAMLAETNPNARSFAAAVRLQTPALRVASLLAPILLFIFSRPFFADTDPDYWWHVRTGQIILETRHIPAADLYSFTAQNQPWVRHEWLMEVIFYAVYRLFGYVGNVALFGLIGALTWLVVYRTCRARGIGELAAILLTSWGFVMAMGAANVRPQAITALLLAVVALVLTRYRRDGDGRRLWLLPPLLALWVNLHGGYVTGLALLWLAVVGETIKFVVASSVAVDPLRRLARRAKRKSSLRTPEDWIDEERHSPSGDVRPLFLVALVSTGATLLNPRGVEALLYPLSYAATSNASLRHIVEWQSPNFHQPYFLIFAASLLLAMLLGLWKRPHGPTETLWGLAFALMALQSIRFIPLYAVVMTPLLAARLQAELPALGRSLSDRRPALLPVVSAMLLLVVLFSIAGQNRPGLPQLGSEPSAASYPSGALHFLQTHDLPGNLFNEYHWGGYLLYHLYPQRLVFADGSQADAYHDEAFDDYLAVSQLAPGWGQILEKYDVHLMIVEKDGPLAVVLAGDPAWQEAYAGDVERLFVRKELAP